MKPKAQFHHALRRTRLYRAGGRQCRSSQWRPHRRSSPAPRHRSDGPRGHLAEIMDLDIGKCRSRRHSLVPAAAASAAKLDLSLQPYIALAALAPGTVRLAIAYSRQRVHAVDHQAPPLGNLAEGSPAAMTARITAFDFEGVFNTGAYASWGPTVANPSAGARLQAPTSPPTTGPARKAVLTNCPPAGAFQRLRRAPGSHRPGSASTT